MSQFTWSISPQSLHDTVKATAHILLQIGGPRRGYAGSDDLAVIMQGWTMTADAKSRRRMRYTQ